MKNTTAIERTSNPRTREKRLKDMEQAGLVRCGSGEPLPQSFFDLPAAETDDDSVLQAVLDERDEGW